MLELKLLLLLLAANSAPVIARYLLASRWNRAIDNGRVLADGYPLFGSSKTWRGIFSALLLTGAVAFLVGLGISTGLLFGLFSMLGDLLSSFIKRRLGKPPSSQALILDQLPEALLPLVIGIWLLNYSWVVVLVVAVTFTLIELLISPLLYQLGLRRKPY
jgi:CDP-archaeol synthase